MEGTANDHHRETANGEKLGSSSVVVREKKKRIMPNCPNAAADKTAYLPSEAPG